MFITLEGPEGSGKSTALTWLSRRLAEQGQIVLCLREPGGTHLGELVREILLGTDAPKSSMAAALLFNAARAELVETCIRPALDRGETVLCDRFADSSLAYQGFGAGVPLQSVRAANALATGGLVPDLTLLFDLDVTIGLERKAASQEWNAIDAQTVAFHERVRAGFLTLAAEEPSRWRRIDASQPLEIVRDELERCVLAHSVYDPTTGGHRHGR